MQPGSDWRRLHPLSPLLRAGRFVVVAAAVLADDVATRLSLDASLAALLLLGALVMGAVAGWWAWSTTGYRVTDEEVELRTGMLFRRHRRLPLARVESVDIARPLVARLFGLAQVRLEAVSDSESEVRLSYLDDATAQGVRTELRARLDRPASAGGATALAPEESAIVRVPTKELVLAMVVGRVVVVWPAVLATVLIVAAAVGPEQGLVLALTMGPVAALLPVVVGLAETERLHGFTLSERGGGLAVSRGLLNELHQVVPIDRIQAVAVVEPPLWRLFGRAKLVVDIAGYRGGNQQDRRHTSVLLPVASRDVVADVLRRVQPGLQLEGLSYVPAPPASCWRAPVRSRGYSVAWSTGHAVMRSGVLQRRTDIVPHAKVQSLRVTEGPWQRALGLATLHLDTAGTQIRAGAPHRRRDEAERLGWASREAAAAAGSRSERGSPS